MKRKVILLLSYILVFGCLALVGCGEQYEPVSESEVTPGVIETNPEPTVEESSSYKGDYEVIDGETAEYLCYNYQDRSMYIAGLKVFEEFGTTNEGGVSIRTDENALTFGITKATGSVTGTLDGPFVFFKMDLVTNEIIDKKFKPAPNYAELGMEEFLEHSEEVIELTNERMVEIGAYFKELIMEIEQN